ncbi:hypothetical protein KW517_06235, partial [Vibrio fluvialis]|nr:hypothetical protein [Vibrio fluvialis]MBY8213604.1 hypothetical protein [Vibrio fluvialis]
MMMGFTFAPYQMQKKRFIADKRELETKTVVSDRVLSPNKTYTNYRFHVESYVPVFILGRLSDSKVPSNSITYYAH